MFKNISSIDKSLFSVGLFLFIYVVLRAMLLSFTYDESWTYYGFVNNDFISFKYYKQGDTNNHLLNTWLMELSIKLFGKSEFIFRLPNLLSHLLYLVYSAKLVRHLSSKILIIGAFLILNLNPYLLDFFSLARGYGISMGLMMASIYFAYKYISGKGNYMSAFLSVLLASVAVLAYFILINFLLILAGLLVLYHLFRIIKDESIIAKSKVFKIIRNSIIIMLPLLILLYIIPLMLNLKKADALDFGGMAGFWEDVVRSLIVCILYAIPPSEILVIICEWFVVLILILATLFIILQLVRERKALKNSFLLFLLLIIGLSFIANYIQFELLKIPYPRGRYALGYFPLFALLLIFLSEQFYIKNRRTTKYFFSGIAFCFIINFSMSLNVDHVHDWYKENDTRAMMNYLIQNKKEVPADRNKITIGVSRQLQTDVNFYRILYHLPWLYEVVNELSFDPLNDYFYLESEDTVRLKNISHKILKLFPKSNTALVLNEQKRNMEEIYSIKNDLEKENNMSLEQAYSGSYSSKTDSMKQFSAGINYVVDDSLLSHPDAQVLFSGMLYTENLDAEAMIVISFERNSKVISYNKIPIRGFLYQPKEWVRIFYSAFIPQDLKKGDLIKTYLWNTGHYEFFVDDLEFKIETFEK